MLNNTQKEYIKHISIFLPTRRCGKRGPKPIPKEILVEQLFLKFRKGLSWKDLENSTVCYNYFNMLQKRGEFSKFFKNLVEDITKNRIPETIIDSTDIESYKVNGLVAYSGKYHNYCIKPTIEVTKDLIPVDYSIDKGTIPDSIILDKILKNKENKGKKLPYNLYLDKGYEKYERRRKLKKQNCQVRMEQKNTTNNRKRGPKFTFNEDHKATRSSIEKVFAWLKAFKAVKYNRLRKKAHIKGMFIFCLCYVVFMRLGKL